MKTTFLFLSMFCLSWTAATGNRNKRNVFELGSVINCIADMSMFDVLFKLDGYGCYCGLGGEGKAKDEVDECCERHDECYDKAMTNGDCPGNTAYTAVYHYKGIRCGTPEAMLSCDDESSYGGKKDARCAVELCQCDLKIAQCLQNKSLNSEYTKYDKSSCKL